MVLTITVTENRCWIRWASGDDDIGHHLEFHPSLLGAVKSVIQENYNKPEFDNILTEFVKNTDEVSYF